MNRLKSMKMACDPDFWGLLQTGLDLPKIGFLGVPPKNFERAHIDLKIAKKAILGGPMIPPLYFFEFGPFWVFLGHFGPFWAIFEGFGDFGDFDHFWPIFDVFEMIDFYVFNDVKVCL